MDGLGLRRQLKQIASPRRLGYAFVGLSLGILAACSNSPAALDSDTTTLAPQATIAEWQTRLQSELPKSENGSAFDLKAAAASNDLYKYGRFLNNGITSLTAAYRVNKDPDTARYIRDVLAIMRTKLKDEHRECPGGGVQCSYEQKVIVHDGHLNFIYWGVGPNDTTSYPFRGSDLHVMDEMLTHANLAAAAYTLRQAGYTADADFWEDYLRGEFEPKWRDRNNVPTGLPFMEKNLFHVYTQWTRYHYYMYKLTGLTAHYNEAKRLVSNAKTHVLARSDGGYTWGHSIDEGAKSSSTACQPTTYTVYTVQAFQDLAMMDSTLFDSTFMSKVAKTMATRVVRNDWTPLANDICGNGDYAAVWSYLQYPYSAVAPWDTSGELESRLLAGDAESSLGHYNLPAMMILSLGR